MTTRQLEKAIEKARLLPRERQIAAAAALEIIAVPDDRFTLAETKGIKKARASVRAGKYVSDRAVVAFFLRFSV